MILALQVISQQPPGGRCTLYAGYVEVLVSHLGASAEVVFSATRDAHGEGFPSLRVNGIAIPPEDGVILMPADVLTGLRAIGMPEDALLGLAEDLESPLRRLLESATAAPASAAAISTPNPRPRSP